MIFLAGCGILFQATKNNRPTETFMHAITRDCFSFLPVGVLLLCCLNNYRWYECLVFGLGSGLGYLLAVRLHMEGRESGHYSLQANCYTGQEITLKDADVL